MLSRRLFRTGRRKEHFPAEHDSRMNIRGRMQKAAGIRHLGTIRAAPDPFSLEKICGTGDPHILRIFAKKLYLFHESLRTGNIVRVHPRDKFPTGMEYGAIQRIRQTPVLTVPGDTDPRVTRGKLLYVPVCFLRGAIVTDQELPG